MRKSVSKITLAATLGLALAFTFSCSSDDGDNGKEQGGVSSTEISSSSAGTKKSSSSGAVNESSSSIAEDESSSSAIADKSSSSAVATQSSSSQPSVGTLKKEKISGFSQKGPFVKGSAITLSELDDKLAQTGRSFEEIIADDKGSFEIKNIELASPYVMLKATGYYRNEVTGKISTAPINLYAIADIREKSNINVNILTHLEYYRVQKLVEGGKSLKDAKKQAQKEILAVFGISGTFKDSEDMSIFGTTDSDAALLAISVLLQGDLSEGKFSERLADFNIGFRETGNWDNTEEKNKMAEWAVTANLEATRSNILGWNLSSTVPDFEKYVNIYWYINYGLGICNASSNGSIKKSNKNVDYICKDNAWVIPIEYELDTYQWVCKEGEIKAGNVSDKKYVCRNNVWKIAIKCDESKSCQTFTDTRDKQSYYYVKIGEQTWMAENLNYNASSSKCYDDNPAYCTIYGRLYDWNTAMEACPNGWHLPDKTEWGALLEIAGNYLQATNGWNQDVNGDDEYGFSALPSPISGPPRYGWWSASENTLIGSMGSSQYYPTSSSKSSLYSTRCLQD